MGNTVADKILMTIGQLAKRVGLRSSALRYYEQEGLLIPAARSESGYRLYDHAAERKLRLIQRAQRLGLSLADIRLLLTKYESGSLNDATIIDTVEARVMVLERQLTELLVMRHELNLFLQDIRHVGEAPYPNHEGAGHIDQLLDQICAHPHQQTAINMLEWLMAHADCQLGSEEGLSIIEQLQGQHVHIWQEDEAYHILVMSREPQIGTALEALAQLEDSCSPDRTAELRPHEEGFHFVAYGDHAFLYARLFMALEFE